MITPQQIADKASRILGVPITAQMVREIENAKCQLKAMDKSRTTTERKAASGIGQTLRCVCGCGKTFTRTHPRAKIHPACRQRVYADKGLLALCKLRNPEVVA